MVGERKRLWALVLAEEAEGNTASALVAMEGYLAIDPESRAGHILYAMLLTGVRRFDEAEAALRRHGPPDEAEARITFCRAWAELLTEQGRFDAALRWHESALEAGSTDEWTEMAHLHALARRLGEAESCHREAIRASSDRARAYEKLGRFLGMQLRLNEAKEALEAALSLRPNDPDATKALADVAHAEALQDEPSALGEAEEDRLWDASFDADGRGDTVTALVAVERYVAIEPSLRGQMWRARMLSQVARFKEAEATLAGWAPSGDADRDCLLFATWADVREAERRFVEAAEWQRRRTTSGQADLSTPWILMGVCYALAGRLTDAEACHRKAATCAGDPDEALLNLGYVLRAQLRLDEASAALEAALSLTPDYPEAARVLRDVRRALELRQGMQNVESSFE